MANPTHPRRRARRVVIGVGLVLGAIVLALGVSAWLAQCDPEWWPPKEAGAPAAESFENAVVTQLSAVREADAKGDAAWGVSLSEADVNAWLAHRLEPWLTNRDENFRWPQSVSPLSVRLRDGVITFAASVDGLVMSADAEPEVDASGALWMRVGTVHAGRLPVPAAWVLPGQLPERLRADPMAMRGVSIALGEAPVMADPVIKVDGARRVRVVSVQVREGRLEVKAVTEGK